MNRLNGMPIIVSTHVPLEHYADEIIPIMPISVEFFRLYSRPFPLGWRRGAKMEREQIYQFGEKLLMRPATYDAFLSQIRAI